MEAGEIQRGQKEPGGARRSWVEPKEARGSQEEQRAIGSIDAAEAQRCGLTRPHHGHSDGLDEDFKKLFKGTLKGLSRALKRLLNGLGRP